MPAVSTTRAQEFRAQLARRAIVADGAMGTMLYAKGVFINRCYDELNLSAPDMVRQIHQEYVKAGAGSTAPHPTSWHTRRPLPPSTSPSPARPALPARTVY